MVRPLKPSARSAAPNRIAALRQYEQRASRYDHELAAFEPIRVAAVQMMALRKGERVVDVGCGTGLSLRMLGDAVGDTGQVLGFDPSPAMLAHAKRRLDGLHMPWVRVQLAGAEAADFTTMAPVDAMLLHFTHDVLRDQAAVRWLMQHVKPGGRVVAAGLQWAPLWAVPANLFVWSAAMYSTTCLEGLASPWDSLSPYLDDMTVEPLWAGAIYIARGRRRG